MPFSIQIAMPEEQLTVRNNRLSNLGVFKVDETAAANVRSQAR